MTPDTTDPDANEALIDLAYRLILQRQPDAHGMSHYKQALAAGLPPVELLRALLNSEEYKRKQAAYDYTVDDDIAPHLTPALEKLSAKLQACREIEMEDYERAWSGVFIDRQDLVIGQREYGLAHKTRFWELVNALSVLIEGIDDPKMLVPALEGLPQYDLIIFAEVLEHLPIHPLDLLPSLIQQLTPGGAIYLTTPNCFAYQKLRQIESRWNPQTVYPRQDDNWDAHHHYREYAAKELFNFITEAGGRVDGFYFSDCWPEDKEIADHLRRQPDERGNMVFVVRRG